MATNLANVQIHLSNLVPKDMAYLVNQELLINTAQSFDCKFLFGEANDWHQELVDKLERINERN